MINIKINLQVKMAYFQQYTSKTKPNLNTNLIDFF